MGVDAAKSAPSTPGLSDEWEPTNASLWERVLDVARGELRSFSQGDRTINSPNNGQGYYPWPHPKGIAWAVKQYNGFGGKWRGRREASEEVLVIPVHMLPRYDAYLRTMGELEKLYAGTATTKEGSDRHTELLRMRQAGWVRHSAVGPQGHHYWEITGAGAKALHQERWHRLLLKLAGLAAGQLSDREFVAWFDQNRIRETRVPHGATTQLLSALPAMTASVRDRVRLLAG